MTVTNTQSGATVPPGPRDGAGEAADPDPSELDYALVRLAGRPGSAPLGEGAEPGAPLRAWISPVEGHVFVPDSPLFIVQHPKGEPIKLALDTQAVLGVNGNGTRVRYRTNTEKGSSGSPCFNQSWELVALHHMGDPDFSIGHAPTYNQGIPITKIVERLARSGLGLRLLPPAG